MADTVSIHLRFSLPTSLGPYQDTLIFTEVAWAARKQADVDASKQALADAWVTFRSAQIVQEQALQTAQGKLDKIAAIDAQIADLTAAKAALGG